MPPNIQEKIANLTYLLQTVPGSTWYLHMNPSLLLTCRISCLENN